MRAFEFSLPLQSPREETQLVADPYGRREDSNEAPAVKCNVCCRRRGVRFSLSSGRGRAGVRGKKRSANQRACELPRKSTTLSEGNQSYMPGKAPSPWQLQAAFPLTLALPQGEGRLHPALRRVEANVGFRRGSSNRARPLAGGQSLNRLNFAGRRARNSLAYGTFSQNASAK